MRAAESEAALVARERDGSLDWLREVAQGAALVGVAPSALPPAARMEAERLARTPPQSVRERVGAQDVAAVLAGMLGRLGASPAATSSLLPALAEPLQDAIALCDAADAMLRLEVVHRCTCPRLHVDRLRLRIACSAAGAGTEWLPRECIPTALLRWTSARLPPPPSSRWPAPTVDPAFGIARRTPARHIPGCS